MPYKEIQTEAAISERIDEMAASLIEQYQNKNPLFVCLLRGAVPFTCRLLSALTNQAPDFHPELDYMTVKTYGEDVVSKPPRLVMGLAPDTKVEGRSVIILDDILDEGHTAAFVTELLKQQGAADVSLVVLVQKQKARTAYGPASLFGFEVPNQWVVGMGMDDPRVAKEAYRWMNSIGIVSQE